MICGTCMAGLSLSEAEAQRFVQILGVHPDGFVEGEEARLFQSVR